MSSNVEDWIPEGWEMHTSPSKDVVLYINKNLPRQPYPLPYAPILPYVSRYPTARGPPARGSNTRGPPARYDSTSPTPTPSGSLSPTSSSISSPYGRDYTAPTVEEIRCSHILIKHYGSRRPVSWSNDPIRRSKEEAYVIIRDFRDQILSKETKFEDIAKVFSDCSSCKRYGDLGRFRRGQMQRSFEIAAFALKVGQLSQPVETTSGIHLILRTR